MPQNNCEAVFVRVPDGFIDPACFKIRETPRPEPSDGQVVIHNRFLSLDPYMRMGMLGPDAEGNVGRPLSGRVVGEIAASRHPDFSEGDTVFAMGRWEAVSCVDGSAARKVDPGIAPLPAYLSVLGFTGLTAWAGLKHYANMKSGETIFVSAASGAVGSMVGQIARLFGLRVTGCAGSDEKVAWVTGDAGFDAAFNYKSVENLDAAIAQACPDGIDIDFENVGGDIFDAVFNAMKYDGRLVICGGISQYNRTTPQPCVPNLLAFITKRLRMQGFSVRDHADEIEDYIAQAAEWLRDGKLTYRETIVEGLDNAPEAFAGLFRGDNFGKLVIAVG